MYRDIVKPLVRQKTSAKFLKLKDMSAFIAILTAIIGAAASAGVNYYNQQKQEEANQANIDAAAAAQQSNQQFNRESAEIANQETRRNYWELYSPEAKVKQLRQAGLSVGLMYGGGGMGGGGSTAAQAASAPSPIPTIQPNLMNPSIIKDIMEVAKAPSQIKKTEKEAEKNIQDTANAKATINKIIAETEESGARKTMIETDNQIKQQQIKLNEIAIKWETETYETRKDILDTQFEQMECTLQETMEKIEGLQIENSKKEEMLTAAIQLQIEQKNKFIEDTILTKANTELTRLKQEAQKIQNGKDRRTAENYIRQAEKAAEFLEEQIKTEKQRQQEIKQSKNVKEKQSNILQKEYDFYETKMYTGMFVGAVGAAAKLIP